MGADESLALAPVLCREPALQSSFTGATMSGAAAQIAEWEGRGDERDSGMFSIELAVGQRLKRSKWKELELM